MKGGKEMLCNRYLGNDTGLEVVIRCPLCGKETLISKFRGETDLSNLVSAINGTLITKEI